MKLITSSSILGKIWLPHNDEWLEWYEKTKHHQPTCFLLQMHNFFKYNWCINTFIWSIDTIIYIHSCIKQAIKDVRLPNVVQVVIDNARNCKLIDRIIIVEYTHIVWSLCVTHQLDLMVEDNGKHNWVKEMLNIARSMVTFVTKSPRC